MKLLFSLYLFILILLLFALFICLFTLFNCFVLFPSYLLSIMFLWFAYDIILFV